MYNKDNINCLLFLSNQNLQQKNVKDDSKEYGRPPEGVSTVFELQLWLTPSCNFCLKSLPQYTLVMVTSLGIILHYSFRMGQIIQIET